MSARQNVLKFKFKALPFTVEADDDFTATSEYQMKNIRDCVTRLISSRIAQCYHFEKIYIKWLFVINHYSSSLHPV